MKLVIAKSSRKSIGIMLEIRELVISAIVVALWVIVMIAFGGDSQWIMHEGKDYKVIRFTAAAHIDNLDWIFEGIKGPEQRTIAWLPEERAVGCWDKEGRRKQVCFGPVELFRDTTWGKHWIYITPAKNSKYKDIDKNWEQTG